MDSLELVIVDSLHRDLTLPVDEVASDEYLAATLSPGKHGLGLGPGLSLRLGLLLLPEIGCRSIPLPILRVVLLLLLWGLAMRLMSLAGPLGIRWLTLGVGREF